MNSILYKIIFIYLFFLPFVNAFAYNSFITIPFFASLSFLFFYLNRINRIKHSKSYSSTFLLIYWLLFAFTFITFSTGEKCINQFLTWSYSFFIYFYCFKNILIANFNEETVKFKILKPLTYGVIFTAVFVLAEFISKNFLGIAIDDYIPRGKIDEMNSTNVLGGIRCRGFTEEPSHLGFYFLSLCPIAFFWIVKYVRNIFLRVFFILLISMSILFSFSSGAFALALFTILMYVDSYFKKKAILLKVLIVFCIALFMLNIESDNFIYQTIAMKFDEDSLSGHDRMSRLDALKYMDLSHVLLGYGPAAYSTLKIDSFISLLLGILMNTGLLGIILMALFFWSVYREIRYIDDYLLKTSIKIAFFNCCLFFIFGDLIYIPWFWVVASLACVFSCFSQRKKISGKNIKLKI